jgi:hypothetical protein
MKTPVAKSLLAALLAALVLVPSASSDIAAPEPCWCSARASVAIYPNACVSPLGLTTTVTDGICPQVGCQDPRHCEWSIHFYAIERYECGNDWELFFDLDGQMECGQQPLGFSFLYKDGSVLATVILRCKKCAAAP